MKNNKYIDLTHTIEPEMPVYPGTESPNIKAITNIEKDGYRETSINLYSHVGTHIDAPAHILCDGDFLDELQLDSFIGRACLINYSDYNKEYINKEYLMQYRDVIEESEFVIINTGWSRYWGSDKYFYKYPILDVEAAKWLTGFNLKGIGIDAISVDKIDSSSYEIHKILLSNKILIVENLSNLNSIKEKNFMFSAFPLKYKNADGAAVRAIAMY